MAYNSTIKPKIGNCSKCGRPGQLLAGKCHGCYWNDVRARSAKKQMDSAKDDVAAPAKGSAELNRWFNDRRKEMTGRCAHCGGLSCKYDGKYFKFSIAHILPKSIFKSVATHPSNFIELCFWNESCHTNMDNGILDMTEMNCWDTIVSRFQEMYPSIAEKEKKRIPNIFRHYIEVDL